MYAVQVSNLAKRFGATHAVVDVSFEVLLLSLRPQEWLTGKILGLSAVTVWP